MQTVELTGVIRLGTQKARARFVRKEVRKGGWTIDGLAAEAELSWKTVNNFAQELTRWPRMSTVVKLFGALGYDVVFLAKTKSKGTIGV